MSVFDAFLAGSTRRWHTHERLSGSVDRVDGHSARVARSILMLHPSPSLQLIHAALVHDDGEHAIGDLKGPAKSKMPDDLRAAFEDMEVVAIAKIWGPASYLTDEEQCWLKFCDRMDAVLWAAFHAPDLMRKDEWIASIGWCRGAASQLGVEADFDATLAAAYAAGGW